MPLIAWELVDRLPVEQFLAFCRRNPIQQLWVFGSVLDDWKPESDVDLLVAQMVGRTVDFVDADSVENPFVRKHIREHRVLLYGA